MGIKVKIRALKDGHIYTGIDMGGSAGAKKGKVQLVKGTDKVVNFASKDIVDKYVDDGYFKVITGSKK